MNREKFTKKSLHNSELYKNNQAYKTKENWIHHQTENTRPAENKF
jgi:hypothetical protein